MGFLRRLIRRLLPAAWVREYRTRADRKACEAVFAYDAKRFYDNSMESACEDDRRLLTRISKRAHVLEKGLAMPEMRPGFGQANLMALIDDIEKGLGSAEKDSCLLREAVAAVAEYRTAHERARHALEQALAAKIEGLLARYSAAPSEQPEMTRQQYFAHVGAPFDVFSASRHSFRQFEGAVEVEQIRRAVALANQAPSACNRQPWKVHLVTDRENVQRCLALQNGNRGFGHRVDKLLVLTVDQRTVWLPERRDLYTNGGIYLMNLCYALHFYQVAHCILNWSAPYQPANPREPFPDDLKLRGLLGISEPEVVIAMVACGGVPEVFRLTQSPRLPVDQTLVVHT